MGELVKGCLVVISIALATGHYRDLRAWAMKEAFRPMHNLNNVFVSESNGKNIKALK